MTVRLLVMGLSLLLFLVIIEFVRRERLTFKYAVGWLAVSFCGFLFSWHDRILSRISTVCGFELLSNFVFFSVLCAFVFLSLFLTILVCQQNGRNDRMAQRLGLLENLLKRLQEEQKKMSLESREERKGS